MHFRYSSVILIESVLLGVASVGCGNRNGEPPAHSNHEHVGVSEGNKAGQIAAKQAAQSGAAMRAAQQNNPQGGQPQ